jgi:hypothetical protein
MTAVLLAIGVLGPPLGKALFAPPGGVRFWETSLPGVHPEPIEHARYVLALGAPPLLAVLVCVAQRLSLRLRPSTVRMAVRGIEVIGVAFAVVCLVAQWRFRFGPIYGGIPLFFFHRRYFSVATLVTSVVGSGILLAAARVPRVRMQFAAWTHESRGRWIGATLAAALVTVIWLLHAFNTEHTIANAHYAAAYHIQFTFDETAAVLDGRSPLVNFVAQYGSLWPYLLAAVMALLGTSIGVFSAAMCTISGLAMLAMYGTLRHVTRSAISAVLLFLPCLATSFFLLRGPLANRYTAATIFSDYPMRYAGPWFLAWLTARHLSGERPRRAWPLFLVAGLVALNNADHGIPALGAVVAALVLAGWRPSRRRLWTLVREATSGLLAAFVLVSILTLARAGALPHLEQLFRFARLYAAAGWAMEPMPPLGFHIVVYLTFVAALGVATVRAIDHASDRLLTGMLGWAGVFGLGAGSYYVGQSNPEVLVVLFGIWAFTVALLLVTVLRRLATRGSGWPTPMEAACVIAFGLAVCSLAQTPTPWSQVQRLERTTSAVFHPALGETFVAAHTHRGERVAILMLLGHRMGYDLGLADVTPYTGSQSMPLVEQLEETVKALRRSGGRKLFLSTADTPPEALEVLQGDRFRLAANDANGMQLWIARRGA